MQELDPNEHLRSDLWPTMTIGQLARQQELAMDKITKMQTLVGFNSSPSYINIYGALHAAMTAITDLINAKQNSPTPQKGL